MTTCRRVKTLDRSNRGQSDTLRRNAFGFSGLQTSHTTLLWISIFSFLCTHTRMYIYIYIYLAQDTRCERGASCVTELLCSSTDNQQETFSYLFHLPALKCCIPVTVTHSCQIFKPSPSHVFSLSFSSPLLLLACIVRLRTTQTRAEQESARSCCSCHLHSYMKIASQPSPPPPVCHHH